MILYDNVSNGAIRIAGGRSCGLSNVAVSTVNLLGHAAPEMWDAGIFEFGKYRAGNVSFRSFLI